MKLAELGEFGLIEWIRRAVPQHPALRLGIGDDCAVTRLQPGEELLTTTDLLIEGVHFRRDWTDLYRLGRKCVAVNVSDLAAMGGEPRFLFLGLGLPATMSVEECKTFLQGVLDAATLYGAVLAGGDTCGSPGPLLISVTAEGAAPAGRAVCRSGARPGDRLYVSGTVGDSALALRELRAGRIPAATLAERHHDPTARANLGRELRKAGLASAMIDISDGLLADLGHLLQASACGAVVESVALPLSSDVAAAVGDDATLLDLVLHGGEDYELLFTVPAEAQSLVVQLAATQGIALTEIGQIVARDAGLTVKGPGGKALEPHHSGFDHFRNDTVAGVLPPGNQLV